MRLMGALYLLLSFLAGITIGSVEIALINCVVFLLAALLFTRWIPARWEPYGTPFAMTGALCLAVMWPMGWSSELEGVL